MNCFLTKAVSRMPSTSLIVLSNSRRQSKLGTSDLRVLCFDMSLRTRQNVLPMVNKGLALFQWKQDIGAAEGCCQEALEIDPECEAAVATLAQLSLQQSKIDTAVDLFKRQMELARSEPELANTLTYMYASIAQKTFIEVRRCWKTDDSTVD